MLALFMLWLGIGTDYAWTRWALASTNHQAVIAANWSVMIFVCGLMYTIQIVERNWVGVLLYIIGCWIGTFMAVRKKDAVNG